MNPNLLGEAAMRVRAGAAPLKYGRVMRVTGQLMEAFIPDVRVGDLVETERQEGKVAGEVVGLRDGMALVVPLSDVRGVSAGARISRMRDAGDLPVSEQLLGRVVDVFGNPADAGPAIASRERVPVERSAPPVSGRAPISKRFETGVRVIDGLLTLGRGQRAGIFAGAGVGKTMLVREILANSKADVKVIGLVGERGCEVHDLLVAGGLEKSVIVAATSDRSPLERVRGAQAATAVAEYFRDRGANVLLLIDSLTRYAMALREIGLAAGEPPATKGYPPSVFGALPRLLERVAPLASGGSITGLYTVLVEGDDLADPVADTARSLLDGHIVLSRHLASRGHFPAVDVLASTSRVAHKVTAPDAQVLMERARTALAARRDVEELKSFGAYVPGTHAANDEAMALGLKIDRWSKQRVGEKAGYDNALRDLGAALGNAK